MNEDDRVSLVSALEKAFEEVGVNLYEHAPRLLRFVDDIRPTVEAVCSPQSLNRFLASATDAEAAKFAMYAKLFTALPTLLAGFVEESVIRTAAAIPPKVGPPNKLTPENKREIVKRVSHHYLAEGLPIGIAQTRVAQQLGLGKRTIQTAWSQRQHLAAQPFQSIGEVWKLLQGKVDELAQAL